MNNKGFTLIELLITMATLASLLVGVTLGSMYLFVGYRSLKGCNFDVPACIHKALH